MTCHEIEALKLGLMNSLGVGDDAKRDHARAELEDEDVPAPVDALAGATTLDACRRHLDAALVDLEEQIAQADPSDQQYDYLRGRLVATRDAEATLDRLLTESEGFLEDLGDTHDLLHEIFPDDE